MVTSCVGTAFYNRLLKERQKGRENEEEDVNNVNDCPTRFDYIQFIVFL